MEVQIRVHPAAASRVPVAQEVVVSSGHRAQGSGQRIVEGYY